MTEIKKVSRMGKQKVIIVPTKSKIDFGDFVVFNKLNKKDLKDYLK
ncbi:MAG: hypothetical protein JSW08_00065 [archaeon]|nr:MAG: hypothetical protein JSW08_00065 [archaeon]